MPGGTIGKILIGPGPVGRGVFAARPIPKGEVILRFSGPMMTFRQVAAKGAESMNALQIGRNIYLDLEPPGLFVNHSCNPNAGVNMYLELVSIREIAAGAEIFYDYSTVMNEYYETMACRCGDRGCRKIIGDFHGLPAEAQDRYIRDGLAATFILDELHDARRRRTSCRT